MQRTARLSVLAITAAALMALTATATAGAAPAQSVVGNINVAGFHLVFNATRPANAPANAATGIFDAESKLGPLTLMRLHGPVTCLHVDGNRMGLFYEISSATPSIFSMIRTGIYIYVTTDGAGHAVSAQFLPIPVIRTSECTPLFTLLPAMGSTVLTS